MAICRLLAGYSLGRADIVRRAMSKKKMKVLEEERKNFIYGNEELGIDGCLKRGVSEEAAISIFDEMQDFAKYAFPKGHAVSYAVISFQTAYLKCHYPREYMAALLTSVLDVTSKVSEYIAECQSMGISVLPPDVNESVDGFTVVGDHIRFGLGAVKNVGHSFVQRLAAEREAGGAFATFRDFCQRMTGQDLNRRVLDSLIRVGALDSFGFTRATLLANYDRVLDGAAADFKQKISGQLSMFELMMGGGSAEQNAPVQEAEMKQLPELDPAELLRMEKETAGLYLSGHPMEKYKETLRRMQLPTIGGLINAFREEVPGNRDGDEATLAGIITQIRMKATKSGSMMAYITVEDSTASIETLIFSRTLTESGELLRENNPVVLQGRLSGREEEDPKLVVNRVRPLIPLDSGTAPEAEAYEERREQEETQPKLQDPEFPKKLFIRFNDENRPYFERVQAMLRVFHGTIPVWLYDTATKEYTDAGKPQYIMASPVLYAALRELLGAENVVVQ